MTWLFYAALATPFILIGLLELLALYLDRRDDRLQ